MQHQHGAEQLDRCKILVGMDRRRAERQPQECFEGATSVTRRLTPMPRGSERPKSSARIHGSVVRFIAIFAILPTRSRLIFPPLRAQGNR